MISSISEFLEQIKLKALETLKQYDNLGHPGLIGDMYEGLTKDILDKSIFKGLDLHISRGKITNSKGDLSGEIDCMLTIGSGEAIPFTENRIHDITKVVAVIQVKKNLYSRDIKDCYHNLKSVVDLFEPRDGEEYHGRLVRNAWRLTCNSEVPTREELKNAPMDVKVLHHFFLMEAMHPLRIGWGFYGFKHEYNLRESFVDFLQNAIEEKTPGLGPINFPNLIICGKFSLIKSNGMPFTAPIKADGWWPFYGSSNISPIYYLLELIWTRLHYMYKIDASIFGTDLENETFHGFLLARYEINADKKGWEYFALPTEKEFLSIPLGHEDWTPAFLNEIQFKIIQKLCVEDELDIDGNEFLEICDKKGKELNDFLTSLRDTGLVQVKKDRIRLIVDRCACGIAPDGKRFAAENKTGRVDRWLKKTYGYP